MEQIRRIVQNPLTLTASGEKKLGQRPTTVFAKPGLEILTSAINR
jgi:hypothetical protein